VNVGRGAIYLFADTLISMCSGYVFWLVVSKIATTEIVGNSATAISLATIFITIAIMGVPTGVQRFLGKSFSEQKLQNVKVYLKASFFLTIIGSTASSFLFFIMIYLMHDIFRIDFYLLIVAITLLASSVTSILFRSIIISSLNTKMLPVVTIISTTARFVLVISLVFIGIGSLGVVAAYTILPVLASILLFINIMLILKPSKDKPDIDFIHSLKNTLTAGTVSWIPAVITTFGSQLGTIVVFGSQGANQAGVYFIAFSIASVVWVVMLILLTIAYPALSAMQDGRKKFVRRMTMFCLIIAIPFSTCLIFYSKEVMQFFGQDYLSGSSTLEILLLSTLFIGVTSGINILAYSYGNYRQVLTIGLASSIPRTALYFVLVPIFGGIGAAISFTAGSIIGFIASIFIANKIGMQILWKSLFFILSIPLGFAFVLSYVEINYFIGTIITLVASYLFYFRLKIITRSDLHDSLTTLPDAVANPILKMLNTIAKKLNRDF